MKYILTKYSSPGWEKEFASEGELKQELYKHICLMCREGEPPDMDPVDAFSSVDDLLYTACGCEYGVEEIES